MNTWEGFSKKLKDHENGASHKKSFNQWLLLNEGINTQSTVDKQAMKIFLAERTFWRNVLERLIDIVIFLGERNLAFRGSDETLGSSQNGNFLGLFELLARDVAAAPQTPQLGGARPTLGAQVSLKLLFGYVTIFSSADLFTTDLNCRKKLACDIISECNVILSRRI